MVSGRSHPLSRGAALRAAHVTLTAERRTATLSIAFIARDRMDRLNRRWKRKPGPTDVLAFPLAGPDGSLAGDIYICPWVAVRNAKALDLPVRQELARLVIHGVLHVLGYDHPDAAGRTTSPMWRRQERLLKRLLYDT